MTRLYSDTATLYESYIRVTCHIIMPYLGFFIWPLLEHNIGSLFLFKGVGLFLSAVGFLARLNLAVAWLNTLPD